MWRSNSVIRWWETRQAAFDDIYTEVAEPDETQPISHSLKTVGFSQEQGPNRAEGKWRITYGDG